MLNKYKHWLIVNGNAPDTVKNYLIRVSKFLKQVPINKISEEKISNYLLQLHEKFEASTINAYRNAIKSFADFLKKDIEIPDCLPTKQTLADSINEEFFEKEILPVVESEFRNSIKVKAILYFMFYTGIRISEIELERNKFNFKNRTAKIYQKKVKKERIVFFPNKASKIIQIYFTYEPEDINAFNLKKAGVKHIFKKLNTYFKDINIYPHLFRHSFATMFMERGGDVYVLKEFLGHQSIQSTMRYVGLKTSKLKALYDEKIK